MAVFQFLVGSLVCDVACGWVMGLSLLFLLSCCALCIRIGKMVDEPSHANLLGVNAENYKTRSLQSMDLEDLQEWVESADVGGGDD